ncbi:MAG: SocA family protein [Bacteroidetes bacterium]|nr:SocA family protein [Bacteroidota bacterium]MCW5894847.1 SocA family protein [Bacteroidota bacterium]
MKTYNTAKFKELVLHICYENRDNPKFSATVLNKMLYYTDFFWYAQNGSTITGDDYIREKAGPIPKHLVPVRENLKARGHLVLRKEKYFGYDQIKPTVEEKPDLRALTEDEIDFATQVVEYFKKYNATELSNLTHKELSWQVLKTGETIPPASIFLRFNNPVPLEAMGWAKGVIKKIRLAA